MIVFPQQTNFKIPFQKWIKNICEICISKIFFKKDIPLEIDITAFYGEAPHPIRNKDVCKNESKIARNKKYWATKKSLIQAIL